MANNARLGGSPLGLIGLKSSPDSNGRSTFNGGNSRNVIVGDYNKSRAGTLFTGKRTLRAWPNITKRKGSVNGDSVDGSGNPVQVEVESWDTKGLGDVSYPTLTGGTSSSSGQDNFEMRKTLHNNNVYDTSLLNIIEQLSSTKGSLRPADFAYLKNVGVYPNNRLMIARRFASPSSDNIMVSKTKGEGDAMATLISWVPEGQDFLDFTFGEEWMDADADFKGILNALGEDLGLANMGGIGGAAGNALPLPGFSEIFQRAFLAKLGLLEESAAGSIPAGNPNLIKQAKRRKTIGYSEAGSGLKTGISIKMVCEYELKYISGIDPTIVWMDLIGMILRFGTSSSETYGLSPAVASKLIGWANNPDTLIRDVVSSIKKALTNVIKEVGDKIKEIFDEATKAADEQIAKDAEKVDGEEVETPSEGEMAKEAAEVAKTLAEKALTALGDVLLKINSGLVQKYRVKILGIVNALSGLPSTPWHITIGNPLRPMFCSGDMLTDSVQLKFGPQLAFNDLPSSITVEFTLINARPLGLQEIMGKFNSGYLRTVDVQKSFYETKTLPGTNNEKTEPPGFLPFDLTQANLYNPGTSSTAPVGTASSTGGPQSTQLEAGTQSVTQSTRVEGGQKV